MSRVTSALGCRVKSGRATTVLLAGPASAPRVLDRHGISLSDPAVPGSVQPFHADFGTEQTNPVVLRRLIGIVKRSAARSMAALFREYRGHGHHPRRMGIVVGSLVDPASITNPHIRAHPQEGRLFRTVVEAAARRQGVRPVVVLERELYAVAARAIGGSPREIQGRVRELGRSLPAPWGAEEKCAAAAAWLVLASRGAPAMGNRRGRRRAARGRGGGRRA